MPELPEVETTMQGILPHVLGRVITEVDIRERRLRWPVPKSIDGLAGVRIDRVSRRGKYILLETARGTMLLHLGMSGSLRILSPDVEWRKHDHVALRFDSGMELRFHDPRRFGCLLLCEGDAMRHALLAELGPEPLSDDFSVDYLLGKCKGRKTAIKLLIMNSKIVVGVGNIYACEALFMAGIHPAREAGKVSKKRLEALVDVIRQVLAESIEMGGTTLRDFLREDGTPGYFKQSLRVYDREGEPCLVCKAEVKRMVQSKRSTFYCGKCQR